MDAPGGRADDLRMAPSRKGARINGDQAMKAYPSAARAETVPSRP